VTNKATTFIIDSSTPKWIDGKTVSFGGGMVWVGDRDPGMIYRFDPKTERVTLRRRVATSVDAIAFGDHSLWVIDAANQEVTRLTREPVGAGGHVWVAVEFAHRTVLAVPPGSIGVTASANNKLRRTPSEPHLSDAGTEIRSVSVGRYPRTVAVDPDS